MASVTAGIKNTTLHQLSSDRTGRGPWFPLDVRCQFVSLPHTSQRDNEKTFQMKVFHPSPSSHCKYMRKNKQTNNNQPTLDINPFGSGFLLNNSVCLPFTFHSSPQTLSKSSWQSSAFESSPLSLLGEVTVLKLGRGTLPVESEQDMEWARAQDTGAWPVCRYSVLCHCRHHFSRCYGGNGPI